MEKWEEGYYITAMAGSMSGASLVVMSKGTPYTQQSYKVMMRYWLFCLLYLLMRGMLCVRGEGGREGPMVMEGGRGGGLG